MVGIVLMIMFSWQDQNFFRKSLTLILDWRVLCQAKVLANYFLDFTLSRYKYYSKLSHWVGLHNSNCTDPPKLLESIVAEPSDLFKRIHFYHGESRNKSSVSKVYPTLKNGIISKTDHEKYGRCFTATPTQDMIQRKIQGVIPPYISEFLWRKRFKGSPHHTYQNSS